MARIKELYPYKIVLHADCGDGPRDRTRWHLGPVYLNCYRDGAVRQTDDMCHKRPSCFIEFKNSVKGVDRTVATRDGN